MCRTWTGCSLAPQIELRVSANFHFYYIAWLLLLCSLIINFSPLWKYPNWWLLTRLDCVSWMETYLWQPYPHVHLTYFLSVEQQIGFFKSRREVQAPSNKVNMIPLVCKRLFWTKLKVHFWDIQHRELGIYNLAKEQIAPGSPVMVRKTMSENKHWLFFLCPQNLFPSLLWLVCPGNG